MLAPEDAEELLQPLIEGMVEDPLWSTFVDRLRNRMTADYASITFRPFPLGTPQTRVIHLASGAQSPPIIAQLYRDSLYQSDPLPYFAMEEGRVYALPELLRDDDPRHEDYRRQLLAPSGMNMLRLMRVREASGVNAWIAVSRRKGDFRAEHEALLVDLAPFLRAALRSYVALERERTNASVAGEVIRRMNFGWLTLDARGRILDADPHAEDILVASGELSRSRSGRIAARSPEVAGEIAQALQDLADDPHSRPRAIVLSRDPWLDMLLVPSSLRDRTTGPAPTLVAYVHADHWSSADRCEQLGQLFDLIPSEARLALALSRGMSIAEAAEELGLTVESARTYSKRIYAKTGARGQADLVRFIHRSVLAIA
jgi:DNA-binding CsgD family transcriptional regulator